MCLVAVGAEEEQLRGLPLRFGGERVDGLDELLQVLFVGSDAAVGLGDGLAPAPVANLRVFVQRL